MNIHTKLPNILIYLLITLVTLSFPTKAQAGIDSWQKSFSIESKSKDDFASTSFRESVKKMADTGANYVTLVIPYYQSDYTSSDLKPGGATPSAEALSDAIKYCKSLGLHVVVKPHPELNNKGWRGNIDPADRDAWFSAYGNIMDQLAELCEQEGVSELVVGTELRKVSSDKYHSDNTAHWNKLIDNVRSKYSGKLSYSAQWSGDGESDKSDEKFNIAFWDKLDHMGLSAYFPLVKYESSPTLEEIKRAWSEIEQSTIKPLYDKFKKPIVFTEVGYRSLEESNQDPYQYKRDGKEDADMQAKLYEALLSYWGSKDYVEGVYWWEWESRPNAGGKGSTSFTPQNKPAEAVLISYFGGKKEPDEVKEKVEERKDEVVKDEATEQKDETTETKKDKPEVKPLELQVKVKLDDDKVKRDENIKGELKVKASEDVDKLIASVVFYDKDGKEVHQEIIELTDIERNSWKKAKFKVKPAEQGEYTVKVGIFTKDWEFIEWFQDVAKVEVVEKDHGKKDDKDDMGMPKKIKVTILDPEKDSKMEGKVKFRACIKDADPKHYDMYWQLEKEEPIKMEDGKDDCKELEIDFDEHEVPEKIRKKDSAKVTIIAKDKDGEKLEDETLDVKF